MNDFERDTTDQPMRARPYGSTPVAISIAVIALVVALVGAAALIILFQDDDDNDGQAVLPTGTAMDENGDGPTPLPDEPTATEIESTDLPATPTETTSTPTPDDADAELTPTDDDGNGGEPTATEEATEPEPDPTEPAPTEETTDASPTPEPFVGDFDVLPPAQLPSGGASTSLELDYQLGMSLEEIPASGTVYLIEWPVMSLIEAQAVAQRFGLNGEVIEEGVGIYRVETNDGSLFISPSETIFRAAAPDTEGELPGDEALISAARDWLAASGFAGSNVDSGAVVGRDDQVGRAVVAFRPSNPSPILAPTPSATITIGPDGELIEARIHWPASLIPSDYGLISPIDLWSGVVDGQGFLEADLTGIDTTAGATGTATISDYSVAYTLAGSPESEQYLVPVISFHGTARLDRTGDEIEITVSVPAVYASVGSIG